MDSTKVRTFDSLELIQMCEPRYVWKEVNYSLFLYDRLEDIYIPEQVYWQLVSGSAI